MATRPCRLHCDGTVRERSEDRTQAHRGVGVWDRPANQKSKRIDSVSRRGLATFVGWPKNGDVCTPL